MIAIIAVYALVGVSLIAFGDDLGRRAFVVGALPCAVSVVWLVSRLEDVVDGRNFTSSVTGVGGLDLSLDLRLDGFAASPVVAAADRTGLVVVRRRRRSALPAGAAG